MGQQADKRIDLRGTPCPMNWVKTRLVLEEMEAGQRLEVLLDDGDPIRSVPKNVKAEGHRVVEVTPVEEGFRLLIERAGDNAAS